MKYFLILLSLFTFSKVFATSASNRIWFGGASVKKVTNTISFMLAGEIRYNSDLGETAQSVFMLGPSYKLNEKHELGILYGHFHSSAMTEHRYTFQHVQKYGMLLGFNWAGRSRIEGRYIEDNFDDSARFRYTITLLEKTDRKYKLFIWNELFLNLTDESWSGDRTIERNRTFIGTKISIHNTSLDIGYMNEYIPRTSGDRVEHIISVFYWI